MPQTGDGVVIEVDVGDLDIRRQRLAVNREAVVVRSYLDLAGVEVLDRLVAAAVSEFELVRFAAEDLAEYLVTEADAEHRDIRFSKLFDLGNYLLHRCRIARAI